MGTMARMWADVDWSLGIFALSRAWWEEPTTLWLGLGLSLILAELVIPQLFVVFLGFGALAASTALHLGWVSSPEATVGVWVAASAALLWALRDSLLRIAPAMFSENETEQSFAAPIGSHLQVVWVDPKNPHRGRVQYQDMHWDARSVDAPIEVDTRVQLLADDEALGWLVKPSEVERDEPASEEEP